MEPWLFWLLFITLIICYSVRLMGVSITGLFTLNHPSYRDKRSVARFAYAFIALQLFSSIYACLILINGTANMPWLYSFIIAPLLLPEIYYYGMTKLCANHVGKHVRANHKLNTHNSLP